MKVYLAGFINNEVMAQCLEWRKAIRTHYENYKGARYPIEFLDPCNGEAEADIKNEGLESTVSPKVIMLRDYHSVVKLADITVANMNTFGRNRAPVGCYSNDTEVLTENGWMLLKEIVENKIQIKVATLSSSKEIEYKKIDKYHKHFYDGEMYHLDQQKTDIMVTPNHRILTVTENSNYNKIKFIRADSLPNKVYVPKKVEWNSSVLYLQESKKMNIDSDKWLSFLGWYISEGSLYKAVKKQGFDYRIIITQKKKENFQNIRETLLGCKFNVQEVKEKDGTIHFIISNKKLYNTLLKYGKGALNKKLTPELLSLNKEKLKIFYNSFLRGDGHRNKKNYDYLYTSSKELSGNLQELIIKLGFHSGISKRKRDNIYIGNRKINTDNIQYTVTVHTTKNFRISRNKIKKVNYKEFVYCLEVPNHSLLVRRNGLAIWCGNTIMEVAWAWEHHKPVIVISNEEVWKKHPMFGTATCVRVDTYQELLDKKILQFFYKGWNHAIY